MMDYIGFRVTNSASIQNNLIAGTTGQFKFCQHLQTSSCGSFLFAKLTLDLIERGHLVAKSQSFKVLPVTLAQIYQLHFNLRFPTTSSFEKVADILSVCLAALYPLTILEIYYSVNSLNVDEFVSWEAFLHRFKVTTCAAATFVHSGCRPRALVHLFLPPLLFCSSSPDCSSNDWTTRTCTSIRRSGNG